MGIKICISHVSYANLTIRFEEEAYNMTDSKQAKELEALFMSKYGGSKAYQCLSKRVNLSKECFSIITFNHFLIFFNTAKKNSKMLNFCAFFLGYILGIFHSRRYELIPSEKSFKSKRFSFIFYDNTPNQKAQVQNLLSNNRNAGDFFCFSTFGYMDYYNTVDKENSAFKVIKKVDFTKIVNDVKFLFKLVLRFNVQVLSLNIPAKHWFKYGFALSPATDKILNATEIFAKKNDPQSIYFTGYCSFSSILASSFNKFKKEVLTISSLHGSLGFTYFIRSACRVALIPYSSDVPFLRKYSFSQEYIPLRDNMKLYDPTLTKNYKLNNFSLGYGTNLLTCFGDTPSATEKNLTSSADHGYRCNAIVKDIMLRQNIMRLYQKIHPREKLQCYDGFVDNIKFSGAEVTFCTDMKEFEEAPVKHYIVHFSSIALDLLYNHKRVYIYKQCQGFDSETSLGKLVSVVGFETIDAFFKLFHMSDEDYWSLVEEGFASINSES